MKLLITDKHISIHLNNGHISKHADAEIKRMKKEKLLTYDSRFFIG